MGTTAQKLQAVLNAKNAIKEKFDLPDDMPFSQYAENIKGGGEYYKCESVSTNTWSGYKAYTYTDVEDNKEYYAFEENLTTDTLSYGEGFTPAVGKIYNADATVMVGKLFMKKMLPTDGLLIYAPLTNSLTETTTGQTLTVRGSDDVITTKEDRACAYFGSNGGVYVENINLTARRTVCCWVYKDGWSGYDGLWGQYQQVNSSTNGQAVYASSGSILFWPQGVGTEGGNSFPAGEWFFVAYQLDQASNIERIKINNGEWFNSRYINNTATDRETTRLCIGGMQGGNYDDLYGYMAHFLFYNRVLSDDEITEIYEYTLQNDTPQTPSEPENPDTPDEASTGNLVLAGWQDSLPTMGGSATITSVNGVWTKGRWDGNTGFTEDSTAEGQDAAYQNADGTGIISYYSSRWYLDPNGYVGGYAAIETSTTGDENPYNADGTSLTWNSSEGFTTGTVLPEQGGGSGGTPTPVLHFESQEHPALPGDLPSKDADGDYYLVDSTATGWYRVWKHESKDYYISATNDGMDDQWVISSVPADYPSPAGGTIYAFINAYNYPDPWTDGNSMEWLTVEWGTCMFVITMTMENS